jgi:predicted dithiol-disulfide oxidoreductase (DUF899 family)
VFRVLVVGRRSDRIGPSYYAPSTELVVGTYNWLDLTARGREEDWEEPPDRSHSPLMGWIRRHDRYDS